MNIFSRRGVCRDHGGGRESENMVTPSTIDSRARRAACWLRSAYGHDDDERGQGMVEYALMLVLIAIVVIVVLQVVGQQVNNVFSNVSNGLSA
jgi:pilus assembly protein Flp/PilA